MSTEKLSRHTILVLIVLVPLGFLPWLQDPYFTVKHAIFVTGVAFLCALNMKHLAKFSGPAILLMVLNVISLLYTQNPYYTRVAAVMNVGAIVLYHFSAIHLRGRWIQAALWASLITGGLISLIAALQFTGLSPILPLAGPTGTIGNTNYLGAYLIFPLFYAMTVDVDTRQKWLGSVYVVLTTLCIVGFFVARARASWIGTFVGGLIFLVLCPGSLSRCSKVAGCAAFAAIIFFFVLLPSQVTNTKVEQWKKNIQGVSTLHSRVHFWRASVHLWWTRNPILGTGLWSFRNLVYEGQAEVGEKDSTYFSTYPDLPKPRRAHNEYLEILNDGGIVAAVALLWFFVGVMRKGFFAARMGSCVAAGMFSCIIAIMVDAVFFFPFRLHETLTMTVISMGLMEGREI